MAEEFEYFDDNNEKFNPLSFASQNLPAVVFFLIGILLTGTGIFSSIHNQNSAEDEIQIIDESVEAEETTGKIVVEVSGAVNKPGVYELPLESRIEEALEAAGGINNDADIEWIAKTINRAAKLTDGQKVYIKKFNEQSQEASANNTGGDQTTSTTILGQTEEKVNINEASQSKLEDLWGIGPVTAKSIIEHRPYSSVEELLQKKILKTNVYERNKDLFSVY